MKKTIMLAASAALAAIGCDGSGSNPFEGGGGCSGGYGYCTYYDGAQHYDTVFCERMCKDYCDKYGGNFNRKEKCARETTIYGSCWHYSHNARLIDCEEMVLEIACSINSAFDSFYRNDKCPLICSGDYYRNSECPEQQYGSCENYDNYGNYIKCEENISQDICFLRAGTFVLNGKCLNN